MLYDFITNIPYEMNAIYSLMQPGKTDLIRSGLFGFEE